MEKPSKDQLEHVHTQGSPSRTRSVSVSSQSVATQVHSYPARSSSVDKPHRNSSSSGQLPPRYSSSKVRPLDQYDVDVSGEKNVVEEKEKELKLKEEEQMELMSKKERMEKEEEYQEKEKKGDVQKSDVLTVSSVCKRQDDTSLERLTVKEKNIQVIGYIVKILLILILLYLFICSLDLLSSAFSLLGGKQAGEVFKRSDVLRNPVAGLMMGVLATVLVQSSSTSTSIVISMVAAQILQPEVAVPIVMGANIGTSVTNTLVSLGQITNRDEFRRAFAGATVHDMFNLMTVAVLLPLEMLTGYLYHLSKAVVDSLGLKEKMDIGGDLLKVITKPFTSFVVQVSSSDIKKIATGKKATSDATLLKLCCDKTSTLTCCLNSKLQDKTLHNDTKDSICETVVKACLPNSKDPYKLSSECLDKAWENIRLPMTYDKVNTLNCDALDKPIHAEDCCKDLLMNSDFYKDYNKNATIEDQTTLCETVARRCYENNPSTSTVCHGAWKLGRLGEGPERQQFSCSKWASAKEDCRQPCVFLFRSTHVSQGGPLTDEGVGAILLVISLVLLCVCLVCLVKLLHSLLRGPIATLLEKFVNADFPGYCAYFTGYLAILIGAGITILVQSSSIFTSTLTPLVGIGVIHLDRMYPLTLGSNVGTTITGILAALAQSIESIPQSLQVAFCHLFFNISGIIIFYPLPFFRPPIGAATFLGNTTANHRWFAVVYIIVVFFLIPLVIFALSIPGWYVLAAVLIPLALLGVTLVVLRCLQIWRPSCLPPRFRTWDFLPLCLRSLEPYDNIMKKLFFCKHIHHHHTDPA